MSKLFEQYFGLRYSIEGIARGDVGGIIHTVGRVHSDRQILFGVICAFLVFFVGGNRFFVFMN